MYMYMYGDVFKLCKPPKKENMAGKVVTYDRGKFVPGKAMVELFLGAFNG